MRVHHEWRTALADEHVWAALAGGTWGGPIRVRAPDAAYAGRLAPLDVDEDERRAHAHVQARRVGGWGGVAGTLELRPTGRDGAVTVAGDLALTGDADEKTAGAVIAEIGVRVTTAAYELTPSPADDPAWRRRLAARAALAVAVGAVAGLAGARWGRGRRA